MRSASQHLDFDLELAKSQSSENPVYYVQYAHARCCSILRLAAERGVAAEESQAAELLRHPAEQALIRRLIALPDVIADAAERHATHELPRYAMEVASLFSQFYRDCHVLSDEPAEAAISSARLALVDATRQVLANLLGLLGVSAPSPCRPVSALRRASSPAAASVEAWTISCSVSDSETRRAGKGRAAITLA